jgi:decaprenyl-phosphate phosphoribosyltransferase
VPDPRTSPSPTPELPAHAAPPEPPLAAPSSASGPTHPAPSPAHPAPRWRARFRLLRVHQWTKNAFVVAPLFFSQEFDHGWAVARTGAAFVAFCAGSSLVYVLNDWSDRERDARHPTKHTRPLASGALTARDAVAQAIVLGIVLLAACATLVRYPGALVPIGIYLALNVAYSFWLRSVNLLDIAVIAAGFVLRVLAGTGAVGVEATSWIVLCTGLLALLLGLGKRRGDLQVEGAADRATLEHYDVAFIDLGLGTVSAAVITFYALFTVSDYSLARFESEHLYVTTFPVALGILRYLQVIVRGETSGSPSEILLQDRTLQAFIAVWLVLFGVLAYVLEGS